MSTALEGLVLNPHGFIAVYNATVVAVATDGTVEGSTTTNSQGYFSLSGLSEKKWLAKVTSVPEGKEAAAHAVLLLPNSVAHTDLSSVTADLHHAGFIGLLDNASEIVGVDSSDYITITDDGVINADAVGGDGGALALTIDQAQIDHGSVGGLVGDDHARYADLGGRTGGQILAGSDTTGETITVAGNVVTTDGSVYLGSSALFELAESSGQLKLPTSGSSAGILIGGDALWYRVSADTWRTPDAVIIDGNLTLSGTLATLTTRGDLLRAGASAALERLAAVAAGALVGGDGTDVVATVPKRTIMLTASGGTPTTTAGCAAAVKVEAGTNDVDYHVLDFDDGSDEFAFWGPIAMPANYDGGVMTAIFYWTTTATDTDGVAWAIQLLSLDDNDAIDSAWGTAVVVTDDAQSAAGEVLITAATGDITPGGTAVTPEMLFVRVFRDVSDGNDDMTEDARLLAVKLLYTVDGISD